MAEVIWTRQANHERIALLNYGQKQFGQHTAKQMRERINSYLHTLAEHPKAGMLEPLLANREVEYRSLVVHKLIKLIYRIQGDKIFIVDLWDTRREPSHLTRRIRGK